MFCEHGSGGIENALLTFQIIFCAWSDHRPILEDWDYFVRIEGDGFAIDINFRQCRELDPVRLYDGLQANNSCSPIRFTFFKRKNSKSSRTSLFFQQTLRRQECR